MGVMIIEFFMIVLGFYIILRGLPEGTKVPVVVIVAKILRGWMEETFNRIFELCVVGCWEAVLIVGYLQGISWWWLPVWYGFRILIHHDFGKREAMHHIAHDHPKLTEGQVRRVARWESIFFGTVESLWLIPALLLV